MSKSAMAAVDDGLAPLTGNAAIPRDNGEVTFNEPWEATSFGLVVSLTDQGNFEWETFRQNLIKAIDEANGCETYYESWTRALHATVVEVGLLADHEIESLKMALTKPH